MSADGWTNALRRLRDRAGERFVAMRWPTPADEDWRRTDLTGIDPLAWEPASPEGASAARPPAPAAPSGDGPAAGRIVFDGSRPVTVSLDPDLRRRGVRLAPLSESPDGLADALERTLSIPAESPADRFEAWQRSAWTHGLLLNVPAFTEIAEPLVIDLREPPGRRASLPFVVARLEEGARATVVLRATGGDEVFWNAGVDIRVGPGASLAWYESQTLGARSVSIGFSRATVERDGRLEHLGAALGGRLVRARLDCSLAGPGAEAHLHGICFPSAGQHADLGTIQRHLAPKALSRAVFKSAVRDGSRAIFQGLIDVSRAARGTDAFLTNRNLLLDPGARADSVPILRIGNNDVKCSHGSTTGRLREEELFYLESRGLARSEARELLVLGFFDDLLDPAPERFRIPLAALLRDRLAEAA